MNIADCARCHTDANKDNLRTIGDQENTGKKNGYQKHNRKEGGADEHEE